MKIVLLPGLDGTGILFQPFTAVTPEGWTTDTISYPLDESMSYVQYFNYVRERLPSNEKYVLLGESFSGPIAIKLASENPRGLVGLVLCNTFARKPWLPIFRKLPWSHLFKRQIPKIIMRRMGADKNHPELCEILSNATSSVSPEVLANRLKETLMVDVSKCLSNVSVPILYLHGTADTTVRNWSLKHILGLRPDVIVSEYPVAHLLLQLVPVQAWNAIVAFRQNGPSF